MPLPPEHLLPVGGAYFLYPDHGPKAPEGTSMPTPEKTPEVQVTTETGPAPAGLSRRSMLRGAAGVGAAGLAATALASTPALAASRALKPAASTPHRPAELTERLNRIREMTDPARPVTVTHWLAVSRENQPGNGSSMPRS